MKYKCQLIAPGQRPSFYQVATHLWGQTDFDSDGNSISREDNNWTELTVILRDENGKHVRVNGLIQRVDIDPISENPLVLEIRSESKLLAQSTGTFLQTISGGDLTDIELD